MSEKDTERKSFDLRLASVSPNIRDQYISLLLETQTKGAKANKGRTITVSTEQREELLKRAEQIIFYGNADPKKMQEDWEAAHVNGRAPIGGAQDD